MGAGAPRCALSGANKLAGAMVLPAARAFAFEPGGVQASPVAFVHRGASFALNGAFHPDPVSCLIQSSEMFGAGVRATVMADARKFN